MFVMISTNSQFLSTSTFFFASLGKARKASLPAIGYMIFSNSCSVHIFVTVAFRTA